VTNVAANVLEQLRAGLGIRRLRKDHVTRRRLGSTNELSEMIDVGHTDAIGSVFGVVANLAH
jgi:hypothetical protein